MDYFSGKFFLNHEDRVNIQKDTLKYFVKNKKNIIKPIPYKLSNPEKLDKDTTKYDTKIDVIAGDTLDIVCKLTEKYKKDYSFLVMANSKYPGGGWKKGSSAQEENICRRTNLPFVFNKISYPIKRNENVFVDMITIIKNGEKDLYSLRENKILSSCLLSAAPFYPSTDTLKKKEEYKKDMYKRMKNMLRSFYKFNKKRIVLGAWGCGAFKNPPEIVAQLFKKLLNDEEFKGKFKHIVFVILDGVKSKNYNIFKKIIKKVDN